MPHIESSYLASFFKPKTRKRKIKRLIRAIEEKKWKFDTIVVRGLSGITMGSILANELETNLTIIRKSKDTHSSLKYEGYTGFKKFMILDDIISSGHTARYIIKTVDKYEKAELVGIALYNNEGFFNKRDVQEEINRLDECRLYNKEKMLIKSTKQIIIL